VRGRRGTGVVELLVAVAIALAVLGAAAGALGAGGRLLAACAIRGESEDTVQLALEALAFDVRRAGWDPARAGLVAIREATPDRLAVAADLDADGRLDAGSEESVTWVCDRAGGRLSRIVGRQSMPLAEDVAACEFRYLDRDGLDLAPGIGLDAAARARVRAVGLRLAVAPPGGRQPSARRALVALRTPE
jgi:Tfp pilus assembly protein PilW